MTKYELIYHSRNQLRKAKNALDNRTHENYCKAMSGLLNLLMVELVGGASNETQTKIDNFKPLI